MASLRHFITAKFWYILHTHADNVLVAEISGLLILNGLSFDLSSAATNVNIIQSSRRDAHAHSLFVLSLFHSLDFCIHTITSSQSLYIGFK